MRIQFPMPNGTQLNWGGRPRFAVFRLTLNGGFVVKSGNENIRGLVQFAKQQHQVFGWRMVVIDTVDAKAIASFPTIPDLHG